MNVDDLAVQGNLFILAPEGRPLSDSLNQDQRLFRRSVTDGLEVLSRS